MDPDVEAALYLAGVFGLGIGIGWFRWWPVFWLALMIGAGTAIANFIWASQATGYGGFANGLLFLTAIYLSAAVAVGFGFGRGLQRLRARAASRGPAP
ncbi:MAG: hypothetical protein MUD11_15190 [Rhodobacteraceae bacterium]|jgi:hypothetical protein|nr:hypothetical protein [Paracoccaceae bacterium]